MAQTWAGCERRAGCWGPVPPGVSWPQVQRQTLLLAEFKCWIEEGWPSSEGPPSLSLACPLWPACQLGGPRVPDLGSPLGGSSCWRRVGEMGASWRRWPAGVPGAMEGRPGPLEALHGPAPTWTLSRPGSPLRAPSRGLTGWTRAWGDDSGLTAPARDRKSTRLNSSHRIASRMPSSA